MLETGIMVIFGFGAVLVVAAFVVYFVMRRRERERVLNSVYLSTAKISEEQYFQDYFRDGPVSRPIVSKVVRILSEEIRIDFLRISPDEQFSGELSRIIEAEDLIDTQYRLEEEFDYNWTDSEYKGIASPRELMEFIEKKMKADQTPAG